MKKILFCIDSLKPGGAEIIMCNTVNELVKDSNLDITVQLLQKEQKLNLDEKVKVNTFMNNNIFYRRIIKWMPASILHKLIIKEKYDYEIAFMEGASTKVISGCHNKKTKTYAWIHTDMLACVSYAEGYSSVVCEAVILGVPVITTECSGMKDILGDSEYGLIVKNDDISIINGIKKMVTNKEFYQKYLLKVKERRTEFSVDNAVKQLKTKLEI